jgi:hypothetical protein
MIVLFSILFFSKSDCVLVLCIIYLHILTASTRSVQAKVTVLLLLKTSEREQHGTVLPGTRQLHEQSRSCDIRL